MTDVLNENPARRSRDILRRNLSDNAGKGRSSDRTKKTTDILFYILAWLPSAGKHFA
jgi:hypothetical protein